MFRFCLPLALSLLLSTAAHARRYYLDASRAEEILSGLVRPRLYGDQWLDIIGGRKGDNYNVRRGDTLWGISRREFGDPFLWRKLWQVNDFLSNPHDISSGTILNYYREGSEPPEDKVIRIPLVKLIPGGASDLDADSILNPDIKNKYRPNILVVKDEDVLGEIAGAYTVQESFGELDEIYLDVSNSDEVKIGDRFAVARYDRTLQDVSTEGTPIIGNLMRLVGEVKVVSLGENLVKAEILGMQNAMQRGDRLIEIQKAVKFSAIFNPPDNFTCRVVMGEFTERKIFSQGEILLLNKGAVDGMREGYLFRVFRDTDPRTGSPADVEPDFSGEVQVIYVSELASIGYIVRNKEPIFIGDTLIPNQLFADPPPPPRRELQVLTLD